MWLYLDEENTSRAAEFITDVVARAGTVGCRGVIHYRNPAVSGQAMTPTTGERIWGRTGEHFVADEHRLVTDRRQTQGHSIYRASIASRGNKVTSVALTKIKTY